MTYPPAPTPRRDDPYGTGTIDVLAVLPATGGPQPIFERRPPRRIVLPIVLFLATCVSTFLVGAFGGGSYFGPMLGIHQALGMWMDGLVYMTAVMGILLAHEMGHFLQAVRYHVPASLPFFIPMPFSPIGTMGAVIGMQGSRANRKQLFDIGLSGPWAGLIVAIPVTAVGILMAQHTEFISPAQAANGQLMFFGEPLIFRVLTDLLRPDAPTDGFRQMNPLLLAGWVGMLITGLNMMPVSQLDGGHVIYALFGRWSRWIARGFIFFAAGYMFVTGNITWIVMLILVTLIGADHPRTADDSVRLGPLRWTIGALSLAIPVFCFMPNPFPSLMP